ncbi:MAG TPA: Holliday junction branch migration protein RuvA [Kofleriaceae bacterium]|nr:Holliday junction branch migration protein RuvA [Kofleriaceae bacterium]
MIGHLRGTLLERAGHSHGVVVDVGGVGYEVSLSAHSLAELGPEGSPVALRVYTHYQQNGITLYGFTGAPERQLFDLLITVKNVGPASAVKILSSGAGPVDLARLIAAGQTSALNALRGVGKKTAELLVVELRERCEELLLAWGQAGQAGGRAPAPAAAARVLPPLVEDVASALGQLGWRPTEVDKAVAALAPAPDATFEGLLRQALRSMPR